MDFGGPFLESELQFPVLRHKWIMAMGKELNEGSLSSLSKSAGTRARDIFQLTWGSALPLGSGVLQTWAEFGSSSRRASGMFKLQPTSLVLPQSPSMALGWEVQTLL